MRIHPIRPDSIDPFIEAGPSQQHEEVRQYVKRMFAAGSMRPEWCFVLEDGGRLAGRVALWTLPDMEKPLDLVLLDLHWDEEHRGGGALLLRRVLDVAQEAGAGDVGYIIDAPPMRPQWQHYQGERVRFLQRAGFTMRRETTRFERRGGVPPSVPERLDFRSLDEVGEDAFLGATIRVSEGTLDREIQSEIEEYGPDRAGRELFELEGHLEHEPSWWHLAHTPEGELVGLIMASRNPTSPVIGYIGVVPDYRGRGYVDDLLAKGTRTLLDAGAEYVRADTDVHNVPMADALRRAGYSGFARRREYSVKLTK